MVTVVLALVFVLIVLSIVDSAKCVLAPRSMILPAMAKRTAVSTSIRDFKD